MEDVRNPWEEYEHAKLSLAEAVADWAEYERQVQEIVERLQL